MDEPNDVTLIYRVERSGIALLGAKGLVQQADRMFSEKVLTGIGCFLPHDPHADLYLSFTVEIVPEADSVFGFLRESLLVQAPQMTLEALLNPSKYDIFVGMTMVVLIGLDEAIARLKNG